MQVGCLGDIIFRVDNRVVQTLSEMNISGSARLSEHQRHGKKSLVEHNGSDPEKISFNITLSTDLGTNVLAEINKIRLHTERGTQLPLVIGRTSYGKFRWLINGYNANIDTFDIAANPQLAVVTLNLIEYVRD